MIVWELDGSGRNRRLENGEVDGDENEVDLDLISKKATSAALGNFPLWSRADAEENGSVSGLQEALSLAVAKYQARDANRIQGRIGRFGSRAFSPHGKFIAFIIGLGKRGSGVMVFDVAEGKEKFRIEEYKDSLMWTGFSPDSATLVSTCWDQGVKIIERYYWQCKIRDWAHRRTQLGCSLWSNCQFRYC